MHIIVFFYLSSIRLIQSPTNAVGLKHEKVIHSRSLLNVYVNFVQ